MANSIKAFRWACLTCSRLLVNNDDLHDEQCNKPNVVQMGVPQCANHPTKDADTVIAGAFVCFDCADALITAMAEGGEPCE